MQEGGEAKETAPSSGGGEGGHIQVFQCVWTPPGYGELFQILGAGHLSDIQILNGGSKKTGKDVGGVVEVKEDSRQGGGGTVGVRSFL